MSTPDGGAASAVPVQSAASPRVVADDAPVVDKHPRSADDDTPLPDAKRVKTETMDLGQAGGDGATASTGTQVPSVTPALAQDGTTTTSDQHPHIDIDHDRDGESEIDSTRSVPPSSSTPASATASVSASASAAASPDKKSAEDKKALERRLRKAALDKQRRERKKAEKIAAAAAEAAAAALAADSRAPVSDKVEKSESKDKKRPRSKLDELKAERARSASTGPGTPRSGAAGDDDNQYCVCKGANEDDETYIGCEVCDNWFHPSCMGIEENDVDLLDVYVCPPCEERTGKVTVYKRLCKRGGCERTARLESKFCSSRCAFQHAQGVAASIDKAGQESLTNALAAYPSPTPSVAIEIHAAGSSSAVPLPESGGTAALLASLEAQAEDVARAAQVVAQRQALLARAVERWEALAPAPLPEGSAPAPKKKSSKNKRRDGEAAAATERPCGFDHRLLWDDGPVAEWATGGVEEAGEEETCAARRRCERHQGWQRTIGVALDVEYAQLERRKAELDGMVDRVERTDAAEAAGKRSRAAVHARLV